MSRAIPLGPLVLALAGAGLMGVSAYLMISGETKPPPTELTTSDASRSNEDVILLTYHDSVRARGFVDIVLRQSPFVADRSAYSRSAPQALQPAEPELNPKFVGVVGRGGEISALVIWEPGQPAQAHSLRDDTPWGVLTSATSSKLVFESEQGRKELELF